LIDLIDLIGLSVVEFSLLQCCRRVPRVKSEEESRKSRRVLNAGLRVSQTPAWAARF